MLFRAVPDESGSLGRLEVAFDLVREEPGRNQGGFLVPEYLRLKYRKDGRGEGLTGVWLVPNDRSEHDMSYKYSFGLPWWASGVDLDLERAGRP